MLNRLSYVLLSLVALVAVACGSGSSSSSDKSKSDAGATEEGYSNPQILAETAWLSGKLGDRTYAIVDLRRKDAYDAGHIPGAVWYDSTKLKDPDEKLYVIRDSLFAQYLGDIGIDNSKTVVAYDDNAGLSATRFWWVLWYYGHSKAMVLNGGFPKWEKEGLTVSKEAAQAAKVAFKTSVNDKVICALDYVNEQASKKNPNVVILDVRSPAEYSGADVRAAKGGHVPTAVNLDWTRSMSESEPKVWKSAAELRSQFEQAGVKKGLEVITYCQTGVRAAHSLFTLRLVGYDSVRNYDGSWQEWGNNKDTPVGQ